MPVSRLLKSWARPPVSCPTASIFWDCRRASSASIKASCCRFWSVTSRATQYNRPSTFTAVQDRTRYWPDRVRKLLSKFAVSCVAARRANPLRVIWLSSGRSSHSDVLPKISFGCHPSIWVHAGFTLIQMPSDDATPSISRLTCQTRSRSWVRSATRRSKVWFRFRKTTSAACRSFTSRKIAVTKMRP